MSKSKCIYLIPIFAFACSADQTGLVVVLSSDYSVEEMPSARVSLFEESGRELDAQDIDVAKHGLPLSFAVEGREAGGRSLGVRVEAHGLSGEVLVARQVATRFEPDRMLALPVFIARACASMSCQPHESCGIEGCVETFVEPGNLETIEGGEELHPHCMPNERYCNGPVAMVCGPDGRVLDVVPEGCAEGGNGQTHQHELSVNVQDGPGSVTSNPPGINCPGQCNAHFDEGTQVTLNHSGMLKVFEGDCSGQSCQLNMDGPRHVTARFDPPANMHRLQIQITGSGVGHVSIDGETCYSDCERWYDASRSVTVDVFPDPGNFFDSLTGDCGFSSLPCRLTMDQDRFVSVNFMPDTPILDVFVDGPGRVRTDGSALIDCSDTGGACNSSVPGGTHFRLEALPHSGATFIGWQGFCTHSGPFCEGNVHGFVGVTAVFRTDGPAGDDDPFDLDDDGFGEFAFGSPGINNATGRVYVAQGPLSTLQVDAHLGGWVYDGVGQWDRLGEVVLFPGDLDGDGIPDLVVSAPGHDFDRGAVYVVSGGPSMMGPGSINRAEHVLLGAFAAGRFGESMTSGDVNGDGTADLIVSADGKVYVFFGGLAFYGRGADMADVEISSDQTGGDGFGFAVASRFDLDDDGVEDLAIGAPWTDGGKGRVLLFRGRSDLPRFGSATNADFDTFGDQSGAELGFSIAGGADLDGDGIDDLAVGAPGQDTVHAFYGRPAYAGPFVSDYAETGYGRFGESIAAGEDVTGNGRRDLIVGAPFDGGFEIGSATVIEGLSRVRFTYTGSCFNQGACAAEEFGMSVGFAGDLDDDGVRDFAVGSRAGGGLAGAPDRGRVVVFHGGFLANEPSDAAPVQFFGEDQAGAFCGSVPR